MKAAREGRLDLGAGTYTRFSDEFGRGTGGTAQAGQGTGKRDPAAWKKGSLQCITEFWE